MKILASVFLLTLITCCNAELAPSNLAKKLHVSDGVANSLINRITYIDNLNTSHAPYYPILTEEFLQKRGYKIGCEVGVFTAGHAQFILANSNIDKLYCVDSYIAPVDSPSIITDGFEKDDWQSCWETIYHYAIDKLSIFGNRAQFIRLPADKAAKKITNHSLDFVFIDGDHSYSGALADCINYYDKVRSGGIICGDDYQIDDVARALDDFFDQKNLPIHVYQGQTRFWWVEKP